MNTTQNKNDRNQIESQLAQIEAQIFALEDDRDALQEQLRKLDDTEAAATDDVMMPLWMAAGELPRLALARWNEMAVAR